METLSNLGYNTYIQGSIKNVTECLNIVLYNKSSIDVEKISLYNMNSVYNKVLSTGKYVRLSRENTVDVFKYYYDNGVISGFDVILYVSNTDSKTVSGYTEFLNIQGSIRNLSIKLDFSSEISDGIRITISNSLSQVRGENTTINKNFIGDDLFNFTGSTKIKNEKLDNKLYYTNSIKSLLKSRGNRQYIFSGNYTVLPNFEIINVGLNNDIDIDFLGAGLFNKFQVGYYDNDPCAYLLNETSGNYAIISLTKVNNFGKPIIYTTNSINGYYTFPEGSTVNYFAGSYASLNHEGTLKLYDIKRKEWCEEISEGFLLDQLNPYYGLIKFPKLLNYQTLVQYVPDIKNSFFDIENYSKSYQIKVIGKKGEWYILKQERAESNQNLLIYTNLTKSVVVSEINDNTPIVINNSVLMIDNNDYYSVYREDGILYYSEQARKIIEGGTVEKNEDLGGIDFCYGTENDKYTELYKNRSIEIVWNDQSLADSYFSSFKRDVLKVNKVPKIVDCLSGLLFYLRDNKYLNYL